jgi:lipopolysaccharide export system permease protein
MRLLDRYLLRELIFPFCVCLGGFLIFWTTFNLIDELNSLQEHQLRFTDVVEYYLVKTPEFLVAGLPVALLLALLYALTTHARHNEITAIHAAGVSLWRLCRSYFMAGLVASGVLFVLNEYFVPDSAEWAERVLNRYTKDPVTGGEKRRTIEVGFNMPSEKRLWKIGFFNYNTMELSGVYVDWTLKDGSAVWLDAASAVYRQGVWTFYKAKETKVPTGADVLPVTLPEVDELAMPAFHETPEEMKSDIKITARMGRAEQADIPLAELLGYLRQHRAELSRTEMNWLYTKLHGRLATPWTCLVVVLLGIPFGAASGRRNVFVGVASSVFICFAYFILLKLGLALGVSGKLPAWVAAWLPNITFGLMGLGLSLRVR